MRYEDERDEAPESDGWLESSEGDPDPELTEEAGYLAWDPPEGRRNWLPAVWKVVGILLVVALIGSLVLPALT